MERLIDRDLLQNDILASFSENMIYIQLIFDRLVVPDPPHLNQNSRTERIINNNEFLTLLMDSVETSLDASNGLLIVDLGNKELISEHNACPYCEISFPKLEPHLFRFNSPLGMCDECNGLGVNLQIDLDLIIEQPDKSLLDGASRWYGNVNKKGQQIAG